MVGKNNFLSKKNKNIAVCWEFGLLAEKLKQSPKEKGKV